MYKQLESNLFVVNVLASTNIPTEWMSAAVHFFQNIVNVSFIPRYEYARIIVSERQNVAVPSIKLCIKYRKCSISRSEYFNGEYCYSSDSLGPGSQAEDYIDQGD
jgi:hypothetical protein